MRIAFSGAHRTGKTSLVDALVDRLPGYESVDEPYALLLEEGHVFSHPPSIDDFEAQLERSIEVLVEGVSRVLFDRCPVDLLGYVLAHPNAGLFSGEEWLPRIREALDTLDLVVLVPVETPDRIGFARSDDVGSDRSTLDETIRSLLLDDPFGFDLRVLRVEGDVSRRVAAVLRAIS